LLHIYSMTKYDIFSTHTITLAKLEKSQTPFVDKKKSQFITFMTSDISPSFFFISVNHEQHIYPYTSDFTNLYEYQPKTLNTFYITIESIASVVYLCVYYLNHVCFSVANELLYKVLHNKFSNNKYTPTAKIKTFYCMFNKIIIFWTVNGKHF